VDVVIILLPLLDFVPEQSQFLLNSMLELLCGFHVDEDAT
jgi:hypothetical protein